MTLLKILGYEGNVHLLVDTKYLFIVTKILIETANEIRLQVTSAKLRE